MFRGFIWTSSPPLAPSSCQRAMRLNSTAPSTSLMPGSSPPSSGWRTARTWQQTYRWWSMSFRLSQTGSPLSCLLSGIRLTGQKMCSTGSWQTLTGALMFYSINHVQRADAGEYRCRLSINTRMVESQTIIMEVEGELPKFCGSWAVHIFVMHLYLIWRSPNINPSTGG